MHSVKYSSVFKQVCAPPLPEVLLCNAIEIRNGIMLNQIAIFSSEIHQSPQMRQCRLLPTSNATSYFKTCLIGAKPCSGDLKLVAERLSTRLLIVQCGQFAFVCMYIYIYIYIYPSHFNCMGAVSVVSSPNTSHVVLV